MNKDKKEIRQACKKASDYVAVRNPFGVWFVTLYDKDKMSFFEFQYTDFFTARDKAWVYKLLNDIDSRKK